MPRRHSALIAFYFLSAFCSFGQSQVNVSAPPGQRDVRTSGNQPMPNGNSVWIGSFPVGFNVAGWGNDPVALLSQWHLHGTTRTITMLGQPGCFAGSSASMDPFFDNRKIWLWIFKTEDNAAPSPDLANVAEYGLFSSSSANWVFPGVNAPFPSNIADINSLQVNQAVFGTFDVNHLYLGSLIPEPSCFHILLTALGTFASLRWWSTRHHPRSRQ